MFRLLKHYPHASNPFICRMGLRLSSKRREKTLSSVQEASSENQKIKPVTLAYSTFQPVTDAHNAKPLLILHGLFGNKTNWNTVAKKMAALTKKTVITADLRNHGESPHTKEFSYPIICEDVRELLSHLKADDGSTVGMGHSLGGRALMHFAIKFPNIIDKLIIVDISPIGSSPNVAYISQILEAMASVKLDNSESAGISRKIASEQLEKTIIDPGTRNFILTNLVFDEEAKGWAWKVNIEAIAENYRDLFGPQPWTGTYDKPTLFIGGTKSNYLPEDHVDQIKKIFPKAEFRYVEGSHLLHVEKTKEFLEIVDRFLKEE